MLLQTSVSRAQVRSASGSSVSAIQEARDFLSVECRRCGHIEIDPERRTNQKFLSRPCPRCGHAVKN